VTHKHTSTQAYTHTHTHTHKQTHTKNPPHVTRMNWQTCTHENPRTSSFLLPDARLQQNNSMLGRDALPLPFHVYPAGGKRIGGAASPGLVWTRPRVLQICSASHLLGAPRRPSPRSPPIARLSDCKNICSPCLGNRLHCPLLLLHRLRPPPQGRSRRAEQEENGNNGP